MNSLLVSVVIPAYNAGKYLKQGIDSVLAQTFADFEVLVVDDGSTDNSKEVLEAFGDSVKYFHKRNEGVSKARNFGIERATGKYIAFLDADDFWLPRKLERQIDVLENSDCGVLACYSAFIIGDENLNEIGVMRNKRFGTALEDLLFRGNLVSTPSTVVVKRELFEEVGGFDPELSLCADWDMWIRLATRTEFASIDEPLIRYRRHGSNMSNNPKVLETDSLFLLDKAFASPDVSDFLRKKKEKAFSANYMVLAGTYFRAAHYKDFLRCALKSIILDFGQVKYLLNFPVRIIGRRFRS